MPFSHSRQNQPFAISGADHKVGGLIKRRHLGLAAAEPATIVQSCFRRQTRQCASESDLAERHSGKWPVTTASVQQCAALHEWRNRFPFPGKEGSTRDAFCSHATLSQCLAYAERSLMHTPSVRVSSHNRRSSSAPEHLRLTSPTWRTFYSPDSYPTNRLCPA